MEPERISAPDVRDKLINDSALLVCAYDGDPDGHFKIPQRQNNKSYSILS